MLNAEASRELKAVILQQF